MAWAPRGLYPSNPHPITVVFDADAPKKPNVYRRSRRRSERSMRESKASTHYGIAPCTYSLGGTRTLL